VTLLPSLGGPGFDREEPIEPDEVLGENPVRRPPREPPGLPAQRPAQHTPVIRTDSRLVTDSLAGVFDARVPRRGGVPDHPPVLFEVLELVDEVRPERTDPVGRHPSGADTDRPGVDLPSERDRGCEAMPPRRVGEMGEDRLDRVSDRGVDDDATFPPAHGRESNGAAHAAASARCSIPLSARHRAFSVEGPSRDRGFEVVVKLPSSGALPEGQPAGCDTSGLILVHRIFRWLYRELPILIREVHPGDLERAELVGVYAKLDFFALHLHHETEDTVLWDRLTERDPGCALHVDQMREQHVTVASRLALIEPQLAPWVATADPELRDALAGDIEALRDILVVHLDQEEDDIMPVAGAVLSQQEWDELEGHTRAQLMRHRKELPKDVLSLQLGLLLASVPEAEREEWFRANVPSPIRLLYALLMKRRYDRAMQEIYPDRPIPAMV
jgi:hemerythrin-like domain-containing protein